MAKKVWVKIGGKRYVGMRDKEGNLYTSIKDSTEVLGFKYSQYTRRLLKEGNFDPLKTGLEIEPLKVKEKNFTKWFIPLKAIKHYLNNRVERDNTRRFILRTALENREVIEEALKAIGVEYTLELAYIKGKKKASSKKAPKEPEEPLEEFIFSEE